MGIGQTELLLIAAIVMLLFGAKKLPELSRAVGESISGFKKEIDGAKDTAKSVDIRDSIRQQNDTRT